MTLQDDNLTLMHYKEPLLPIPKGEGFGYYGTVIGTKDDEYLQCHLCGKLFVRVFPHVRQHHKMSALEYKEKFQLAYTTALVSENERQRLKERTMRWLAKMGTAERNAYYKKARERLNEVRKLRKISRKETLESKNKKGTCPDQLLDKIRQCKEALGYVPSKHDFIGWCDSQRYVHLIYKTFGSWTKALHMLNMKPKEQNQNGGRKKEYSEEELLEYLTIFYKENNKVPTATDFRRGLLPSYDVYIRRFGSITKARELVGIYFNEHE